MKLGNIHFVCFMHVSEFYDYFFNFRSVFLLGSGEQRFFRLHCCCVRFCCAALVRVEELPCGGGHPLVALDDGRLAVAGARVRDQVGRGQVLRLLPLPLQDLTSVIR